MLVLVVLGLGLLLAPVHAQASEPRCRELRFPVSVAGLLPQEIAGTLCVPDGGASTVQVLVPGGLYNHTYWDVTMTPETRSFRLAMNRAGYATLVLDRLGTGNSTRPPSAVLTVITQAAAVHQVVQSVRAGEHAPPFRKVVLGGHSLGSAIAIVEAGTYRDVDGVIVTGMGHRINAVGILPIFATFVPAALDPAFRDRSLDLGYLTTRTGTRFDSLHRPGAFDASVSAYEEATKDVVAPGELVDGALLGTVAPYTLLVDVPVLSVMASGDPTFCGVLAINCATAATFHSAERPFYSAAARLETHVVKGYGHALNYAPDAPEYHATVVRWADRMIGLR